MDIAVGQNEDQETLKVIVECSATDHAMSLHLNDDEYLVYLSLFIANYYSKQESWFQRLFERIKIAITALRGREYLFEDIVLDKEAVEAVGAFFRQASNRGKIKTRSDAGKRTGNSLAPLAGEGGSTPPRAILCYFAP